VRVLERERGRSGGGREREKVYLSSLFVESVRVILQREKDRGEREGIF
jgi:hypothetical protein